MEASFYVFLVDRICLEGSDVVQITILGFLLEWRGERASPLALSSTLLVLFENCILRGAKKTFLQLHRLLLYVKDHVYDVMIHVEGELILK